MRKIFFSIILAVSLAVTSVQAQPVDRRMEECVQKNMEEDIFKTGSLVLLADMIAVKCGDEIAMRMIEAGANPMEEREVRGFTMGTIGSWATATLHHIMIQAKDLTEQMEAQ